MGAIRLKSTFWGLVLGGLAGIGVTAADFSDPTWPCIQRKVEGLSIALMWPYPIEPVALDEDITAAAKDLTNRFVLRRIDVPEIAPHVAAFTERFGNDPALLGAVFEMTFDKLARQRRAIIKGIEEYSLKQIDLSDRIETTRTEMARLMDAENPDFDRVDALEVQLDWDERIYTDRQRSLTYVCETPVLLEQRLFAIAQMLAAQTN